MSDVVASAGAASAEVVSGSETSIGVLSRLGPLWEAMV